MILLRHALAGDRDEWVGDDSERPLDERGERQARELVDRLAELPIDEILTSPAVRCVQTVQPLAAARGLEVVVRDELSEQRQRQNLHAASEQVIRWSCLVAQLPEVLRARITHVDHHLGGVVLGEL